MLCHDLAIVGTTGTIAFGRTGANRFGFHEPQYRFLQPHMPFRRIERGLSVSFTVEDWLPESFDSSTSSSSLMTGLGPGRCLLSRTTARYTTPQTTIRRYTTPMRAG